MQLEAREKLVTKGEMKSLENVVKTGLGVSSNDTRDFATLVTDYKAANPTLTPQQTTTLRELENAFSERDRLKTEFDGIIGGTIATRAGIATIVGGLKTGHQFAKFITQSKLDLLNLSPDTRTLSYASQAADVFDEVPAAMRKTFPTTVLKEMINSTESLKRNKSSEVSGGIPVEDMILQLGDDEIVEVFEKYAEYLERKVSLIEKGKRFLSRKVEDGDDKIADIFEEYPMLLDRVDGMTDSAKSLQVKQSIGSITTANIIDERKKKVAEALKNVLQV